MPGKPTAEKVEELERLVATLTERGDNTRTEARSLRADLTELSSALNDVQTKIAVLEERLNELKRGIDEGSRQRWALLPPLLAVMIGAVLTTLAQLLIAFIRAWTSP